MSCIEFFSTFVIQNNKEPLEITMYVIVLARDHLLRVRRDCGGSKMTLKQA